MNPSPSSSAGATPPISVCENLTNAPQAASTSVTAAGWTPCSRSSCSNDSAAALHAIAMTNGIKGSSDGTEATHVNAETVGEHGSAPQQSTQGLTVHSWFAVPAHDQIWSCVPSAELWPVASRHLPDAGFTNSFWALWVHCWAPVPLQSYSCTLVPLAVPAAAMS